MNDALTVRCYARSMHRVLALWLTTLGCAAPTEDHRVDFAPLRPGLCEEGVVPCDAEGHAWVAVERDFEDRALLFVVDSVAFPRAVEGRAPGFDLDGIDSRGSEAPDASCTDRHPDLESSVDPGIVGVDNQLQSILEIIEGHCRDPAPGCFDRDVAAAIPSGEGLWAIGVEGVGSFTNDQAIVVRLYTAIAADGPIASSPEGQIVPGQRYQLRERGVAAGTLLEGRVDATFDSAIAVIGRTPSNPYPLELEDPRVRFDLEEHRITRGVIGGVYSSGGPADVDDAFCARYSEPFDLPGHPWSCHGHCWGLSVGAVFTGVPAIRRR